jgi:hypothetical protein
MAQPTKFPKNIVRVPFTLPGDEFSEEDLNYGPKDIHEDFLAIKDHEDSIHTYVVSSQTRTNDGMWETHIHTVSLGPMKFQAVDDFIKLEEMRGDLAILMVSRKYYYHNDDCKHEGLFLSIVYEQLEENKDVDVVRMCGTDVGWN